MRAFAADLGHLLIHQKATFSRQIWLNVGRRPRPQCSACFINGVDDSVESILDLAKTEATVFKFGSGSGTNFSPLRAAGETRSDGGTASGPVAFMRGFDAFAGVFGRDRGIRHAEKMALLNIDHPDIIAFIQSKADEERRARALVEAGYAENGADPYDSLAFQHETHAVRVPDDFMRALERDDHWMTRGVGSGKPVTRLKARHLMKRIAEAAHTTGEPGLQFDSTINAWHTCSSAGAIQASDASGQYLFLDDSAATLASLNLLGFVDGDGDIDSSALGEAVRILVTALDILIDRAGYPTENIARNTRRFRALGIGAHNLAALLMARGLAYDSEAGRTYASALASLITGQAYRASVELAETMGPFAGFADNRPAMLMVIDQHLRSTLRIDRSQVPRDLMEAASRAWETVGERGTTAGFRNAQVTALGADSAAAGMMDCLTIGAAPVERLTRSVAPLPGGTGSPPHPVVATGLARLGYGAEQRRAILDHLQSTGTPDGAPHLHDEHRAVFDCLHPLQEDGRHLHYMGQLHMQAALQPFISGGIAQPVAVPRSTPAEEIMDLFLRGWRLGLKGLTVQRAAEPRPRRRSAAATVTPTYGRPYRRRLPDERQSITHKLSIGEVEGYITVGMYEDGSPGEIFIVMAKEGSVISGLMDSFATAISLALQYGVPLDVLCDKFRDTRFEPSGFTGNPDIPMAKSIMDYIFSWLAAHFLPDENGQRRASNPAPERRTGGIQIPEPVATPRREGPSPPDPEA